MSNPTTPFGWQMPTATDLVTDLPADFEVFGQAVATSMADLLGGTSGQVLAKNSNTDMDFVWVTSDDANAIQNTIVDAKGDLIAASAADTPARLAVGSNGESLIADSSQTTGLRYQGSISAGRNVIINGGFDNWQRGTSFTNLHGYNADRWVATGATAVPTQVISRQAITPGDLSGLGLSYFWRQNVTNVNGATAIENQTRIENVETLAGQTVTLSFYAKADSARTITISLDQNFGSGGSATVNGANTNFNLTTSWARYSVTVTLGSLSGKTIGTSSFLLVAIDMPVSTFTIDLAGFQLELGSVPMQFSRAGGTLQQELAACQRYYYKNTLYQTGFPAGTTDNNRRQWIQFPVTMRTTPSSYSITVDTGTPTADQATTAGFRALSAVGNTTTVAYFGTVEASAEL